MLLLPCTIVGQPENTLINPASGLKHDTIELKACSSYVRNKTCFKKEFAASDLTNLAIGFIHQQPYWGNSVSPTSLCLEPIWPLGESGLLVM